MRRRTERRRAGRGRPAGGATRRGGGSTFWDDNARGLHFYERQADELAVAAFERAVGAAALPLAVLEINLGAAYLRRTMLPEARARLDQGLALDPDNQWGHWLLGQTLKAAGAFFEARAEFEHAYGLDRDSPAGRLAAEALEHWRHRWPSVEASPRFPRGRTPAREDAPA
jgi:tetratricopeptide (TPR) repeat protein